MAAMRAAGRAVRRFVKEEVPVLLRGPHPNSAAAAQPAETLTPARHLVCEKVLALFRGPRPNPAAAAAAAAAEEAGLAKRGALTSYSKRTTQLTKKASESINAEPWFIAFLLAFAFLKGHENEMGKRNGQEIAKSMNEHQ